VLVPTLYYRYYVFNKFSKSLKTSSSGISPLDDFPDKLKMGENHSGDTIELQAHMVYFSMV